MITIPTYAGRFTYLKLSGAVGKETFGFDRWLNQKFYHDKAWKKVKREVIVRDMGCDMAFEGLDIYGKIYVHHMNPIKYEDIVNQNFSALLDPENLVCVSYETHQAIHYGGNCLYQLCTEPIERKPNDTCLWKR